MYICICAYMSTPNRPQIEAKIEAQIDPKSTPNRPQIVPKPNLRSEVDFGPLFGSVFCRLGSSWELSGPLLRASWGRLGAS